MLIINIRLLIRHFIEQKVYLNSVEAFYTILGKEKYVVNVYVLVIESCSEYYIYLTLLVFWPYQQFESLKISAVRLKNGLKQ